MPVTAPQRAFAVRRLVWLDYATGRAVTDAGAAGQITAQPRLRELLPAVREPFRVVEVIGAPAAGWGAWARGELPEGWRASGRGHFLSSGAPPVLRYQQHGTGRELEIRDGSEWYEGTPALEDCRQAHELVRACLHRIRGADTMRVLASPMVTGRDLLERVWRATPGCDYATAGAPQLDAEDRALVRSTSGQGREQLLPPARRELRDGLAYWDGRVFYGGLCQDLGLAPADRDYRPELERAGWHPQRVRVRATIPAGWSHVGLLGVQNAGGTGWAWPALAGTTVETWCDGWEARTAEQAGWHVEVLERLVYTPGNPLGRWAGAVEHEWQRLATPGAVREYGEPGALARRALRALVVQTVGGFAQRTTRTTHVYAEVDDVPAGASARRVGGALVVEDEAPAPERWQHPEWAAGVWGRARARILSGPTGTRGEQSGLLHVPPDRVVAVLNDGLLLDGDPRWPDDGRWGRLRRSGLLPGRRAWPRTARKRDELVTLAREASAVTGGGR